MAAAQFAELGCSACGFGLDVDAGSRFESGLYANSSMVCAAGCHLVCLCIRPAD